ncbi:hypothetical protein JTE90_001978 [Oedothorax gibbosus]|uniref:Uncharacterized protein n=1 Tax=Oedothorax gibbosus TaxID=931172 RepID=A0AAV6TYS4_9ARAC|nr:hypothetical protein JTE90_001978 [Oedothorax gibbosus]
MLAPSYRLGSPVHAQTGTEEQSPKTMGQTPGQRSQKITNEEGIAGRFGLLLLKQTIIENLEESTLTLSKGMEKQRRG